jgi:hypothetical protein
VYLSDGDRCGFGIAESATAMGMFTCLSASTKSQELRHYCQICHLAFNRCEPFFDGDFEQWDDGLVRKALWLKTQGKKIVSLDDILGNDCAFDEDQDETFDYVFGKYGNLIHGF